MSLVNERSCLVTNVYGTIHTYSISHAKLGGPVAKMESSTMTDHFKLLIKHARQQPDICTTDLSSLDTLRLTIRNSHGWSSRGVYTHCSCDPLSPFHTSTVSKGVNECGGKQEHGFLF